ncbi:unnamed protein product [Amoebophrya sp. A120]|nr:unnamed protein product [Amoebophrya sp. A120]|eukprot:GSA120T00011612001.1
MTSLPPLRRLLLVLFKKMNNATIMCVHEDDHEVGQTSCRSRPALKAARKGRKSDENIKPTSFLWRFAELHTLICFVLAVYRLR